MAIYFEAALPVAPSSRTAASPVAIPGTADVERGSGRLFDPGVGLRPAGSAPNSSLGDGNTVTLPTRLGFEEGVLHIRSRRFPAG